MVSTNSRLAALEREIEKIRSEPLKNYAFRTWIFKEDGTSSSVGLISASGLVMKPEGGDCLYLSRGIRFGDSYFRDWVREGDTRRIVFHVKGGLAVEVFSARALNLTIGDLDAGANALAVERVTVAYRDILPNYSDESDVFWDEGIGEVPGSYPPIPAPGVTTSAWTGGPALPSDASFAYETLVRIGDDARPRQSAE